MFCICLIPKSRIETNRSANDIINYCKLIIEKFDGAEELS